MHMSISENDQQSNTNPGHDSHPYFADTVIFFERIARIDNFIKNTGVIVEHIGFSAYYRASLDKIVMPWPENFIDRENYTAAEDYYSTLFRELIFWTGSPKRLNRQGGNKFGENANAIEELIAKLGTTYLCRELGIATSDKDNYVAYWLEALRENKQCIITAASEASKAVDYLQLLQPD